MSELKHYGIPKMRWGFRRYQNYDGTLTAAGKERYGHNGGINPGPSDPPKNAKSGERPSGPPKGAKTSAPTHEDHASAYDRKPVSSMSDAELRRRLNRIDMEQRYSKVNPTHVAKGYDTVKKVLAVAGTVSLALNTAVQIKTNGDKIAEWFVKG